jgi:staphylococcal nuclease domain-containing protein 1
VIFWSVYEQLNSQDIRLATTHDYSASNLSYAKDLYEAEAGAKKAKKNVSRPDQLPYSNLANTRHSAQIWSSFDETAVEEVQVDQSGSALPPQYLDVVVASVKETAPFGFSVQILSNDSKRISS